MRKKLLSVLLALSMVLALAPVSVFAEGETLDGSTTRNSLVGTVEQITPNLSTPENTTETKDGKTATVMKHYD